MLHRTPAISVILVLLGAMLSATPAAADQPIKEPTPVTLNGTFPAGVVCPFQTTIKTVVNETFAITFFDRDGNVRWVLSAGRLVFKLTNDDTGASVTLNSSGPAKITENPDGTLTIVGAGHGTLLTLPGDVPPSSAMYFSGRAILTVDPATGRIVFLSFTGASTDLCAALGG